MWDKYFNKYSELVKYAKETLDIDYEPDLVCVNCMINHTINKHLSFDIQCSPLPLGTFDKEPKTSEEIIELSKENAYYFAKYILKQNPYSFQKEMILCTLRRKVLRISRRLGKSYSMAMYMLWYLVTKPRQRIRIVTPLESHLRELFDSLDDIIKKSGVLVNSVIKNGKNLGGKLYNKSPFEIMFSNGSTIRGLTTGFGEGTSVRSHSADLLVVDEADYVSEEAYLAVYPLIASLSGTEMIVLSTPSGRRSFFYSWCFDKSYKELHRRYTDLETYDPVKDEEFKRNLGKERYEREMLLEFTLQESGVFPNDVIDKLLEDYQFDNDNLPPPGIYTFGIDWNESVLGVHIVILRYEGYNSKYRISNIVVVEPSEFTQLELIEKIIALYELYRPKKIVMDEGFGITQIQALKRWGTQTGNNEFLDLLITVPFGGQIEVFDNVTGNFEKTYAKQFIVQLLKRMLENNRLILPKSQDYKSKLIGQMRDYAVEKQLESGLIKFTKGNVHTLEALMLLVYGMHTILDILSVSLQVQFNNPSYTPRPAVINKTFDSVMIRGNNKTKYNIIKQLY